MERRTEILASILRRRQGAYVVAAGLICVVVVTTAALLAAVGPGHTSNRTPTVTLGSSMPPTPPGTGLVAKVPFGQGATFSWAPDGLHLLIASDSGSRVFDRFGRETGQVPNAAGWLDTGHLVEADGSVVAISSFGANPSGSPSVASEIAASESAAATPLPGSPAIPTVVAGGHGAAAILVSRPGCVGDPTVYWYRDGRYVQDPERVTPFGWSPDGRFVVLGHMACGTGDSEQGGWKGQVQVVESATGRVVATIPAVRGPMAFSPDVDQLAAQSDGDLVIADLGSGGLDTLPGARFLGWLDDESIFIAQGSAIRFSDLDPPTVSPAAYSDWKVVSPAGLTLASTLDGKAVAIDASDGTTLMDLSGLGLVAAAPGASASPGSGGPVVSGLQPDWWSPDGRMIALPTLDGTSLDLIAIDPSRPAPS